MKVLLMTVILTSIVALQVKIQNLIADNDHAAELSDALMEKLKPNLAGNTTLDDDLPVAMEVETETETESDDDLQVGMEVGTETETESAWKSTPIYDAKNGTTELAEMELARPSVKACSSWGDPHIIRFDGKKYDEYTPNGEHMLFCSNDCKVWETHTSGARPKNKNLRVSCGGVDKLVYNGVGQIIKTRDVKRRSLNTGQSKLVWPDNVYPQHFKNEFIIPGLDAKVYVTYHGRDYMTIGITITSLKTWTCSKTKGGKVPKPLCTQTSSPPYVPPVPTCPALDTCCARFKEKATMHGCKEDYTDKCCPKGNSNTCCEEMNGDCKKNSDCDEHEVCNLKSGLCRDSRKRSDAAINFDFAKLVHEKFSQEAAHGTWNLKLNLHTDPCSLVKCKAESQCHGVGKCKKGTGVCTKPLLAKGSKCNDKNAKTKNDVCDGKGACAGVDIGIKLGLPKQHGSSNCYMSNGYYTAKSNAACFLANTDGSKVVIDFTAKTYTQYKFTMKMTESNTHNNNISPHGGFKPCNKDSTGNSRGSSPEFWFIDRNGDWGYGTYNGGFGHVASYTNKAYYGKADPHGGGDHVWTITMKWTGAQYVIQDWDVDGVNFGKYKGRNTGCSKSQNLVTTPKVWAYPGSTFGIKDFQFSQANSIDKLGGN